MSVLLEAALGYARMGLPVFPCGLDKKPLTGHGFKDATTSERTIRIWWTEHPEASIAIPTGKISRLLVLDVDLKYGGPPALAAWLAEHDFGIGTTACTVTGGGGRHIFFRRPSEGDFPSLPQGRFLGIAGTEVKGDGGYIILAPSHHESGNDYRWESPLDTILDAPPWFLDAWKQKNGAVHHSTPTELPETVNDGQRNDSLFRLGCSLRSKGTKPAAILAALSAVNQIQCSPPLSEEEVAQIAKSASKYSPGKPAATRAPRTDGRPTITLLPDVEPMVSRSIAAILERANIGLYQRSRMLVRVTRDHSWRMPGMTDEQSRRFRPPGAPVIGVATIDYLREALDRSAYFERNTKGGETNKIVPPEWVLKGIMARGSWPFPHLEAVIEAPTLRPDGSVLDKPGYDGLTGLLYETLGTTFGPVPAAPTRDDAMLALNQLEQVFADFPFKEPADHSAALAAALSVICRAAIPGPVPLFAVRAPTPGSGKTLLVDAISMLAYGRPAAVHPPSIKAEEERKQMLAIAMGGDPLVLIDNASGAFGSNIMAAVLTSGAFSDRVLGVSETATLPMRTVWFVTGNNLSFRGDLGRRVLPIDLDPRCEHPEEDRTTFLHGQDDVFLEWVRSSRGSLIPAALTVLRAFLLAGKPRPATLAKIGRFSGWDELVRGSLLWLGAADPATTRERVREWDDADLDTLRVLLEAWDSTIGSTPISAAGLLTRCLEHPSLRAAILEFCPGFRGELPLPHALGYALRARRDRIVDGKKLIATPKTKIGVKWAVITESFT